MKNITKICGHGKNLKYKRSNLPIEITDELKLNIGSLVSWEIIDGESALVKIIAREVRA